MIEIPESRTISSQINKVLINKSIQDVILPTSPHKFAWYNGEVSDYPELLKDKKIIDSRGHGAFVDFILEDDITITIGDGTTVRYYTALEQHPAKHQLLLVLDDGSFLVFTVAMYGAIYAYNGKLSNPYHEGSLNSINPLDDSFDEAYFEILMNKVTKNLSVKALLATEQRIPGLGNGVLQDVLFNAGIHPKRKKDTLSDADKEKLFYSVKQTLQSMTDNCGRDTERDLFGHAGKYQTILSKNTYKNPCPVCGDLIVKEAYLGGSVYYCPTCQH